MKTSFRNKSPLTFFAAGAVCCVFLLSISTVFAIGITNEPQNCTVPVGHVANFTVGVTPVTHPVYYYVNFRWYKDGVALANDGNISGAFSGSLTISNVSSVNQGYYWAYIEEGSMYDGVISRVYSRHASLEVVNHPVITNSPQTTMINAGQTAAFTVGAIGPVGQTLYYQWRKDGVALSGATSSNLNISNAQGENAGFYDVLVTNQYGSVLSLQASLIVNVVSLDPFRPNPSGPVFSLAEYPSGSWLAAGEFYSICGQSWWWSLARFSPDGILDSTFRPSTFGPLALLPDGKILTGPVRTNSSLQPSFLNRSNPDGTLDSAFPGWADNIVHAIVPQEDGKILVGGSFGQLCKQPRKYLGRLHADGTLDAEFDPSSCFDSVNGRVRSIALQSDGKILVCGDLNQWRTNRPTLLRLHPDGTLDTAFNVSSSLRAITLLLQPDGKILVGCYTSSSTNALLRRLDPDGTLDASFALPLGPAANGWWVESLALQADGKILVGGYFESIGGLNRSNLVRLHPDGSLDLTFGVPIETGVRALALQTDGRILLGGNFTNVLGQDCRHLARLLNGTPATQSLTCDRNRLTWLRGGASPEVSRVSFEFSTDGTNWSSLGSGNRIPGGWQLSGLALPENSTVRARGYTTGGAYNGCSWFVENTAPVQAPSQPVAYLRDGHFGVCSNHFGFTADGPSGRSLVIEGSTNLLDWTPLRTLSSGPAFFSEPTEAGPARFYRLRTQ